MFGFSWSSREHKTGAVPRELELNMSESIFKQVAQASASTIAIFVQMLQPANA
jgi:hypothetical protein